jgi:hypothetical protein
MTIDQLSIFVENRPGCLLEITDILAGAGVDLHAMSIADTKDFGILRIVVNDPVRAGEVLRNAGCVFSVTKVLAVSIDDKPGGLSRILNILAGADISIEYLYAFITRKKDNAYVIFRVEDNDRAVAALTAHDVKTAGAKDIYEL